MRNPKYIVFTFVQKDHLTEDRSWLRSLEEDVTDQSNVLKLSIPFAFLDDFKRSINACCFSSGFYTSNFDGGKLIAQLDQLKDRCSLNQSELDALISKLSGSIVRFGQGEKNDFEFTQLIQDTGKLNSSAQAPVNSRAA